MANEQNLIPFTNEQSREEAKKNGAKGGKKSGEVRRQRKAFKEQMELLLSLPVKNEEYRTYMENLGIDEDNMDNQMLIVMSIFTKAMKGDLEAFREIKELMNDMGTNTNSDRVVIVDDLDGDDTN